MESEGEMKRRICMKRLQEAQMLWEQLKIKFQTQSVEQLTKEKLIEWQLKIVRYWREIEESKYPEKELGELLDAMEQRKIEMELSTVGVLSNNNLILNFNKNNFLNALQPTRDNNFSKNQYLQSLQDLFNDFAEGFDEKVFDTYVPPKGNKLGEEVNIQETLLEDIVKTKERLFVVLGDSGLGKTILVRWLTKMQWRIHEKEPKARIPLFIQLSKIKAERLKQELLDDYLERLVKLSKKECQMILAKPLLLILDGFDELKIEDRQNLFESNKWDDKRLDIKAVITCRPEALVGKNAQVYFEVKSRVLQGGAGYLSYQLELFTKNEIHAYIERFIEQKKKTETQLDLDWLNPKTYRDWLERLTSLKLLIENPFLLTLVIAVLPRLVRKSEKKKKKKNLKSFEQIHYTRNHIFKEFIEEWFGKQALKLQKNDYLTELPIKYLAGYLLAYAQNLAASLLQEGKLDLILSDKETLAEHLAEPTHDVNLLKDYEQRKSENGYFSKENLKNTLKALRSGCLLKTQAETFQFLHKSLIEYFAAKELFEGLQGEWDFYFQEALQEQPEKNGMNRQILNEEPEILNMLADRVKEDDNFKGLLCDLILQTRITPYLDIVAANAMTILNRAGVSFSGLDLSEVQISKSNLTGALCGETNFQGANLREVILNQAWLSNGLWQGALVEGIQFGERVVIQTKTNVRSLAFYRDEKQHEWILMGGQDGCVYRYSFETNQAHAHGYYNHDYRWFRNSSLEISVHSRTHQLAICGYTESVSVWSLQTGDKTQEITGHVGVIVSVAFSPNGQWLASGGEDKTIRLWSMPGGIAGPVLKGHTEQVASVAYSPNGLWLASGSWDETVRLWSVPEGKINRVLRGHTKGVQVVCFSPDSQWLASGSGNFLYGSEGDNSVRLWHLPEGKSGPIFLGHTKQVTSLSFSSDGQWLVSGSDDQSIRLWSVPAGETNTVFKGRVNNKTAIFSPDNQWVVAGGDEKAIQLWKVPNKKTVRMTEVYINATATVALSPDGKWLASRKDDKAVQLWQMPEGKAGRLLHINQVTSMAFSPDSQWLVSGSNGDRVQLWHMPDGKAGAILKGHAEHVKSTIVISPNDSIVAFSPDGRWIVAGSGGNFCVKKKANTLRLWQMPSGKTGPLIDGYTIDIDSVIFSADSRWLASAGGSYPDRTVRLWSLPDGKLSAVLEHTECVNSIAFSPDGQWLASVNNSVDGAVRLWQMPDAKASHILYGHTSIVTNVAFSPNSQWLVSTSRDEKWSDEMAFFLRKDKTIRVWSMSTFQCIQVLPLWFSIESLSCALTTIQWAAAGEHGHLIAGEWQSNGRLTITWRQKPCTELSLDNANFTHAHGLSEEQQQLLTQHKATVVMPPKTQVYRPMYSLFKPLPGTASHKTHYALVRMVGTKLSCSEELWVVSVARKKVGTGEKSSFSFSKTQNSSLHGFLIIEGIQNHRRFIIRAELTSPGQGKVAIDIKALDDFEVFQKSVENYEANQWQITHNQGMQLIQNIREDQGKVLNYSQWGGKSIFNFFSSKQINSPEVHNCLTWCREQLKKIGIIIPESGREWLFVLPEDVIKQPNQNSLFNHK